MTKVSTLMATARTVAPRANPAGPERALEAMALHPAVEGGPGEAEGGGGVADVAVVQRQGANDGAALQVVEVEGGAGRAALGGQVGGGGHRLRQGGVAPGLQHEV